MANDDIIVDLSNYKDRVGARVAPGRYRVQVEDAEPSKSQAGNGMVNLFLRVLGGEFDGATLVDRLVLTEKSLFRVVGFMQAIGLPTPKKRIKINLRQFIGKVLDVDVDDGEPYNGRVKSEIRGYMRVAKAAGESSGSDLDDLPEDDDDAEEIGGEEAPDPSEATSDTSDDLPEPESGDSESSATNEDAEDLELDEIEL